MLLGMTPKTNEREKPPFETPFDPLRVSLGKPFESQGKQGRQSPLRGQAPRNSLETRDKSGQASQGKPLEAPFQARMVSKNDLCRGYPFPEWAL